jgi:CHAT domain-containing protein/Tfp pilus assembly protein PilF
MVALAFKPCERASAVGSRLGYLTIGFIVLVSVCAPRAHGSPVSPTATSGQSCDEIDRGAVVESVTKALGGDGAGLRPGDLILAWKRGSDYGPIISPFDLSETELEQAPRGPVTLEGTQASGVSQTWLVGPGSWGVETRPKLPEKLAAIFRTSANLVESGKTEEALKLWQSTQGDSNNYGCYWLTAWWLYHAAEKTANAGQWPASDALYEKAIRTLGDSEPVIKAQLLRSWATTFDQRGDYESESQHQKQALAEFRKVGTETLAVAKSLAALGSASYNAGNLNGADEYFQRALAIRERLAPDSLEVAVNLNNLGNVDDDRGDLELALTRYRQALEIKQRLHPDSIDLAATLNNIGIVQDERGELAEAQEYHQQALAIRERLEPGSLEVAKSLNNLGNVAYDRGDFTSAEDYYRKALAIKDRVQPDSVSVAATLGSLGNVAGQRGDLVKAEAYFRRGLQIMQKLEPDSLDAAAMLTNLGIAEHDRGELDLAEMYNKQALTIKQKLDPDSLNLASTLENLGDVAYARHNLATAKTYYDQALGIRTKLAPSSPDMAASLKDVGLVARDSGDLVVAEAKYRQAAEIEQKLAPGGVSYAESLAGIAGVLRARNQPYEAEKLYSEAIDVMDRQMSHLGGSSDVRAEFRSKHAGYYADYFDLLLGEKKPELAFHVLEQSRARTLLEMLAQAHVDIRQGADSAAIEKERLLQAALTLKTNRRINLLQGDHTEAQLAAINKEIDGALAQFQDLKDQIRSDSPSYADLTQPKPLAVSDVQHQLLDSNTVLLDYILGSERSYVFLITPTSLDFYSLPKKSDVENAARHLYGLITSRNQRIEEETSEQHQARISKNDADYDKAVVALGRMVLEPVAKQIQGKRLLIVADGTLQYIPFGILPGSYEDETQPTIPLVAEHEIVNLPSASVLAVLRRQAEQRASKPSKNVAVLADPVFDKNDPRVNSQRTGKADSVVLAAKTKTMPDTNLSLHVGYLTRSLEDVRGTGQGSAGLPRLVFSRREATAIMSATKAGEGMEAVDFRASRETAMSTDLSQYKVVHFATHGLLDNEHPELSGLVLSMVGPDGNPQNGFLDLEDIYNLNLPVDLVVLSACETGLGKEISGEGLVGLTRGFMFAGATRVVASVWRVDDAATAELMGAFYRAMLKNGLSPAAALRHAQMDLRKQKRWRSPYYWAGFTLQGEWK